MYDDLVRRQLPGNVRGISSSMLVAFADDVAILATGHTTFFLEEAMNQSRFGKQIECAAEKATKTVSSLSRLMPNIGGPKQMKRQLLMSAWFL